MTAHGRYLTCARRAVSTPEWMESHSSVQLSENNFPVMPVLA
jgi:hypothetical protein